MLENLKASLNDAVIIKKGDYSYFIHPLSDGIPLIDPAILDEVSDEIVRLMPFGDLILTPEAMGIPLATAVSMKSSIPFSIIRKRSYCIPGEICVVQKTGYSQSLLYINGISKGNKVILMDDIISTGGTMKAIASELKERGVEISGIVTLFNKNNGAEQISRELGINVISLLDVEIVNNKLQVSKKSQ